ncbi:hypothetical protein BOTCAL_0026g00450 [Botryotinia calthae]|uniref:Uncharacterized protein n=1 Tax=Botryotinia calthae TaxID=38488 RepID=A0A4Y8DEB5_9HELO|nr:hypothetical protein BOTCAL_0026g00450 [Botryotinia calthae]
MATPNQIPRLPHNGNPQPTTNSNPQSVSNQNFQSSPYRVPRHNQLLESIPEEDNIVNTPAAHNQCQVVGANSSQTQTQQLELSLLPEECPPQSTQSPELSFKWTNPDPFNTENNNSSVRRALASPTRFDSGIDSVAPDSLASFNSCIDSVAPDSLASFDSGIDSVAPDSLSSSDSKTNANAPKVSMKQRIYNATRAFGIEIKSRMKLESISKREERRAREALRRKSIANGAARAKAEDATIKAQLNVHYDEERRKNSNARRKVKENEIETKAKKQRRKAQEKKRDDQEKRERKEEKEREKK